MPSHVEGGRGWSRIGQGRGARLIKLQDVGWPNNNSPLVDVFKEEVIEHDINEQDVIFVSSIVL